MKRKKKRRFKKKSPKGIYIIPNIFTSASLFGGFFSIISTIHGRFITASIAIIISAILDGLDGRIARYTRSTSNFGLQYDSLSDLVAFGVAPGILIYIWGLQSFGRLGWLASYMYVVCGALRLARFNVQQGTQIKNYFKGLPIPASACTISTMILIMDMTNQNYHLLNLLVTFVLAFLMVSPIQYPSFKGIDIRNRRPFNVLVTVLLLFVLIAYRPRIFLFLIMLIYTLCGPLLLIYRKLSLGVNSKSETLSKEKVKKTDLQDL